MTSEELLTSEAIIRHYYKTYLILNHRINRFLQLREIWESRAENTSGELTFTPKSISTENKQELAMCKMIDYERLANELIDELVMLRKSVREYIRLSGNEDIRLLEIIKVEA